MTNEQIFARSMEAKNLKLRDLFAAIALHGIVSRMSEDERGETDWSLEATDAWTAADAMIANRGQP